MTSLSPCCLPFLYLSDHQSAHRFVSCDDSREAAHGLDGVLTQSPQSPHHRPVQTSSSLCQSTIFFPSGCVLGMGNASSPPPLGNRISSVYTHIRDKVIRLSPAELGEYCLAWGGESNSVPLRLPAKERGSLSSMLLARQYETVTTHYCVAHLRPQRPAHLSLAAFTPPPPFPPPSRIRRHGSSRPYVAVSSNFPFPRTGPAASPCRALQVVLQGHLIPATTGNICVQVQCVVHASGSQDTEYVMYTTSRGRGLRRSSPYRGTNAYSPPGIRSGELLDEETLSQGDGMLCHISFGTLSSPYLPFYCAYTHQLGDVFIQLMTIMSVLAVDRPILSHKQPIA